jgi:YVTN family beta-propeller protein
VRSAAAVLTTALLASAITAVGSAQAPDAQALGSLGALTTGTYPYDLAAAGDFVYVGNRSSQSVSVFDSTDWSPETTVAVGANPTDVNATIDGAEVWVSNADAGTISIISTATNTVTETLSVGGAPRDVLFTADGTTAYVLNRGSDQIQVVDTTTRAVQSLAAGSTLPTQGALSADETAIYMAVGAGVDRVIRFDLVDEAMEFESTSTYDDPSPLYVQSSPDGTELWVINNDPTGGDSIVIMDPTANTVIDRIKLDGSAAGLTFSETGDTVYVPVFTEDKVTVIDRSSRAILGSAATGNEPTRAVAVSGEIAVTVALDNELAILGFDQERLSGADRFATGVEISQRAFPSGTSTVFVASGRTFPDALAAGPAAGTLGAALLLTEPGSLPTVVRDEIARLNPDTIYLVGGTGAVSTAVENALKVLQPNTIRLSGANRYATGAAIVDETWGGSTVPEVFIATGRNYPDALSAGAVAAGEGIPVILVDGSLSTVPQATIDLITELGPTQITIAGGTGAVSAGIRNQLDAVFAAEVRRLSGADRYATSAAINLDAYPTNTGVIYATGTGFADALAGAALAGRAQIPVYLVQPGCVPAAAIDAIYSGATTNLFLLGGTGALSTAVENLTPCS